MTREKSLSVFSSRAIYIHALNLFKNAFGLLFLEYQDTKTVSNRRIKI